MTSDGGELELSWLVGRADWAGSLNACSAEAWRRPRRKLAARSMRIPTDMGGTCGVFLVLGILFDDCQSELYSAIS